MHGKQIDKTISIHAPHEGERRMACGQLRTGRHFNPRSPRGGATRLYVPAMHYSSISIHAPHEGERPCLLCVPALDRLISIHAPHEGERPGVVIVNTAALAFQSTLPTRGSDCRNAHHSMQRTYFNPRSPRGGATGRAVTMAHGKVISIHAPHEGERRAGRFRYGCTI